MREPNRLYETAVALLADQQPEAAALGKKLAGDLVNVLRNQNVPPAQLRYVLLFTSKELNAQVEAIGAPSAPEGRTA